MCRSRFKIILYTQKNQSNFFSDQGQYILFHLNEVSINLRQFIDKLRFYQKL